jgi:hypothetical protein
MRRLGSLVWIVGLEKQVKGNAAEVPARKRREAHRRATAGTSLGG